MNIHYRQITVWPLASSARSRTEPQFRAGYLSTIDLLETELGKLNATDIALEAFIPKAKVRRDGWPLADARTIESPGVILSFHTKKLGNLSYHNDSYFDWRDNLRGIALTLENLRAIRRYGCIQGDEQYRGFTALSAPAENSLAAARTLIEISGLPYLPEAVIADQGTIDSLRRAALRRAHPDSGIGSLELMERVNEAYKMLTRVA